LRVSESTVDPWTLVHALVGVAAGYARVNPGIAMGAAVLYEAAENAHAGQLRKTIFAASGPETPRNVIVDLMAFGAGMYAGRLLRETQAKRQA
jgi:hypothetical protein